MKTKKPTIRVIIDKTKQNRKGQNILHILVTWHKTRAKESTGFYINANDFYNFELPYQIENRIKELEKNASILLEKQKQLRLYKVDFNFTARDVLDYEPKESDKLLKEGKIHGYTVYVHLLPNNSIYIGITNKNNLEDRWKHGDGYKDNYLFHINIKKYGWDNITHLVYKTGLTKDEAITIEKDLIQFYSKNEPAIGRVVLNINHNHK